MQVHIPEADKPWRQTTHSSSSPQNLGHGDELRLTHHCCHSLRFPPPRPPPARRPPQAPPLPFPLPNSTQTPALLQSPLNLPLLQDPDRQRPLVRRLHLEDPHIPARRRPPLPLRRPPAPRPRLRSPADTATGQQQEIEGQDEQQESEEKEQQVEDEVEKAEVKEEVEQEEDDDDDEVRMYSEIVSRNPGDVDALKCAMYANMRRADWGGALRYARRLRDAEPGEVEWRLMVAQLHELKGDLAEAERQFREVLAEEPLLVRALHGLALCMHNKLEGPTVFELLENALQLAASDKRVPEQRNIKLLIAQMHVVMGQFEVASEKLQNLINEDPRDFRPHLCQGIVYALLDRNGDADKQFDIYRSLVPDEFPDKSFINDVILAAKMESNDQIQKEFGSEFLSKK